MKRATVKVSSPSFLGQASKQKVGIKAVFVFILFTLLLDNSTSFAQTTNGCVIGNSVYPGSIGRRQYSGCPTSRGCWIYGGTPTTINNLCDNVTRGGTNCYVYGETDHGLGSGVGVLGSVTKIDCPIDDSLWLLMGASIAMTLLICKRHSKRNAWL